MAGMHARITAIIAISLLGCAEPATTAATSADVVALDDVEAPSDAGADTAPEEELPSIGNVLGLSGVNEPEDVCAAVTDAACGGDITGTWFLTDFCRPGAGAGAAGQDQECEGPGEDEPACEGDASSRICNLLYGGTAAFEGGKLTAEFSVAARVRYMMTDPCLAAIGSGKEGAEACGAVGNEKLLCEYADATCRCEAVLPPESEVNEVQYAVEGNSVTISQGDKGATGTYCVVDDQLTIVFNPFGPEGWKAWVLTKNPQ